MDTALYPTILILLSNLIASQELPLMQLSVYKEYCPFPDSFIISLQFDKKNLSSLCERANASARKSVIIIELGLV